jgi:excisionase family DNA binding protein
MTQEKLSPELERYMSLNGACEYGNFKRTFAYKLIESGKITARKLGKRTLIERASVDRFLRSLPKLQAKPAKRK